MIMKKEQRYSPFPLIFFNFDFLKSTVNLNDLCIYLSHLQFVACSVNLVLADPSLKELSRLYCNQLGSRRAIERNVRVIHFLKSFSTWASSWYNFAVLYERMFNIITKDCSKYLKNVAVALKRHAVALFCFFLRLWLLYSRFSIGLHSCCCT